MFDWFVRAVNKLLEDTSEEERDFWSFVKKNAVLVNRSHFVHNSKFPEFNRKNFEQISETLERRGHLLLAWDGLYTTKKGENILNKMPEPSKLPNTNTIGVSGSGRTTKKLSDDGRNTENFVINTDDIRRLFRPDDE